MIAFLKYLFKAIISVFKSKFKWIALLFLIWLYRIDFMPDTGSGVAKIIQIVSLLGMFYFIHKYKSNIVGYTYGKTNLAVKSCLILYTYALVSTAWAFMPTLAFFLSFQNVVLIMLMIWFFGLFKDFRSMERGFVLFSLIAIGFEWICARINSPGLVIHFLGGASSAALCFVYCAGEWMKSKRSDKSRATFLRNAMILAFLLMVTCTSMGANAAAVIGFAVACLFSGKILWAVLLFLSGGILYLNQDMVEELILVLAPDKDMETIKTGNGRDTIWEALLSMAQQKPIFGWGFACIERTCPDAISGQQLSDAHSNFVGMYGSLGIVGVILFGFHLLTSLLKTFGNHMKPGYLGLFAALITAVINSYSYGFLSGKGCSITVVYFALVTLTFYYGKVSATYGSKIK